MRRMISAVALGAIAVAATCRAAFGGESARTPPPVAATPGAAAAAYDEVLHEPMFVTLPLQCPARVDDGGDGGDVVVMTAEDPPGTVLHSRVLSVRRTGITYLVTVGRLYRGSGEVRMYEVRRVDGSFCVASSEG